jgi:hypothetical protein
MNLDLAIKTSCFCVVKLRNSPAITRVSRLEPKYLNQQSIRPRFNQRLPKYLRTFFLNLRLYADRKLVLILAEA